MSRSPTLRVLARSVNGLYIEERTGCGYRREELLKAFPAAVLDAHARLSRVADGIYTVDFPGGEASPFRLHSRRQRPRHEYEARKAAHGE